MGFTKKYKWIVVGGSFLLLPVGSDSCLSLVGEGLQLPDPVLFFSGSPTRLLHADGSSGMSTWRKLASDFAHERLSYDGLWGIDEHTHATEIALHTSKMKLLTCWQAGYRLWEADIDLEAYLRIQILPWLKVYLEKNTQENDDMKVFLTKQIESVVHRPPFWTYRAALCAPQACGQEDVTQLLLPRLLVMYRQHPIILHLGNQPDLMALAFKAIPAPSTEVTKASELTEWEHHVLDFVILGLSQCGTSSLQWNLRKHPEISFVHHEVEKHWDPMSQRRLLPTLEQVDSFNKMAREEETAKSSAKPAMRKSFKLNELRLSRGMASNIVATQIDEWFELQAMLKVNSELKGILVLCDPVDRFEKRFFRLSLCGPQYLGKNEDCTNTIRNVFNNTQDWQQYRELKGGVKGLDLSLILPRLRAEFGHRLLVIHQESLRVAPEAVYKVITRFLGTSDFSPETKFDVLNSVKGHRTDLCMKGREHILRKLKNRFSNDYRAMREALREAVRWFPQGVKLQDIESLAATWVPDRLIHERTRCEIKEELIWRERCGRRSVCRSGDESNNDVDNSSAKWTATGYKWWTYDLKTRHHGKDTTL